MIACVNRHSKKTETTRFKHDLLPRHPGVTAGGADEEQLIEEHLPLVKLVVGQMAQSLAAHASFDDLYSSGLVGLLDAARKFDPHAGSSFATYARTRIRGAVLDELRRMDWVPRSIHTKARKVESVVAGLQQDLGRVPAGAEIARALKITLAEYEELMTEIQPAAFVCLDADTATDSADADNRHDWVADEHQESPDDAASRRELAGLIARRIQQLPRIQQQVLALYYFEDLRLREIAAAFGLTESRVCQIHAQALRTLRVQMYKNESMAV